MADESSDKELVAGTSVTLPLSLFIWLDQMVRESGWSKSDLMKQGLELLRAKGVEAKKKDLVPA